MNREIKYQAFDKKCMSMHRVKSIDFSTSSIECFGLKIIDSNITLRYGEYVLREFTGLKDKNGKEIYEGDILKINGSTQVVEFYKSSFVTMYIQKTDKGFCEWRKDLSQTYKPEVLGNIHEHPELIKEVKA